MANPASPKALTEGLPTTASKIRALHAAGYSRSEIARFLGIRYQQVRNVLVREEERTSRAGRADVDPAELRPVTVRIGPDGRIVIPAPFRDRLGLKEDDTLFASVVDGEIRLLTKAAAVRRAQEVVRQFVPPGVSLVEELLTDRRREAEREQQDG
jgi:AbrB family looped-hinge helix DNA binding protein